MSGASQPTITMAHPHHPGLRARVQFLEQQHGITIDWRHGYPARAHDRIFRPVVEVVHSDYWKAEPREVHLGDNVHKLRQPLHDWTNGQRIGVSHDGGTDELAVVDGRVIYLLVDLDGIYEYPDGVDTTVLFDAIFDVAVPMAAEHVKGYDWSRERQAFVNWRVEAIDAQVRTWRANIRDNDYELDNLTRRIANIVRVNAELRQSIVTAGDSTRAGQSDKAAADFTALTRMIPDVVEDVRLDYGRLKVRLAPVSIKHGGHAFPMGRYTLTFDRDSIRIAGDNGHEHPHPHVSTDGVPCWGNLAPAVGRLLGEGEYAALVSTIRQFLQSYNERDAYRELHTWDPDYEPVDEDEDYEPDPDY